MEDADASKPFTRLPLSDTVTQVKVVILRRRVEASVDEGGRGCREEEGVSEKRASHKEETPGEEQ